ncbi:MAG TPA: DUF4431 domain-containing protein [Thermoanaerobaculia bacterium]|jgi:hypothetical protein|nr:DUF4431 domain-containing protein [Thermoanaerobaculia bacterium]
MSRRYKKLALLFVAASVSGFVGIGAAARSGQAPPVCLGYEPKVVALTGVVKRVIAPGPPNYESVAKGDQAETIWVLHVEQPICVEADPTNESNSSESGVTDLQLIISNYGRYRSLLGKRVEVSGQLTHATTGHHHTAVLLAVEQMRLAPKAP